jgi:hypothetical protein
MVGQTTLKHHRRKLNCICILDLIKGICNDKLENKTTFGSESLSDFDNYIENYENENTHLQIFLENIKQKSIRNFSVVGNMISAYYLKELLPDIMLLCKHFLLWTNVLSNLFRSPCRIASSASVKNNFKELKTQILKFDGGPMRADKFILKHLTSIDSNVKLFKSKELRYESSFELKLLMSEYDELSESENLCRNDDKQCIRNPLNSSIENIYEVIQNNKTKHDIEMSSDESEKSITAYENWKGKGIVKKLFPKKKKKLL